MALHPTGVPSFPKPCTPEALPASWQPWCHMRPFRIWAQFSYIEDFLCGTFGSPFFPPPPEYKHNQHTGWFLKATQCQSILYTLHGRYKSSLMGKISLVERNVGCFLHFHYWSGEGSWSVFLWMSYMRSTYIALCNWGGLFPILCTFIWKPHDFIFKVTFPFFLWP